MTAVFSATFTPTTSYNLFQLSLAAMATGYVFKYQLGLIDLTGITASINAGTQYAVQLQDQITYPTTI